MKIQWLGHSAFRLEESTGTAVVTDPYHSYFGIKMPEVRADVVTVSHAHRDHDNVEAVGGKPLIVKDTGAVEVKGIHIMGIRSYHDDNEGTERGENLIFKYRLDGVDVCHMGDIGQECTPEIAEAIGSVNVLLLPVGGNYTVDSEQAKEYVDRLMPDIVIPMHYRLRETDLDLDKVDGFLKEFDSEAVEELDTDSLEITRAQFDNEYTKVIVFKLPEQD